MLGAARVEGFDNDEETISVLTCVPLDATLCPAQDERPSVFFSSGSLTGRARLRIRTGFIAAVVVVSGSLVAPGSAGAVSPTAPIVTLAPEPGVIEDEEPAVPVDDDVLDEGGELDVPDVADPVLPRPTKPSPDPIFTPDADTVCDPGTRWINDWSAVKQTNAITHASGHVVPEGGTGKVTKQAEFQTQLTASITYTSTARLSAKVVEVGLEGEVGHTLAAEGSVTSKKARSVEMSISRSGSHVFFNGRRKAKGSFNGGSCSGSGKTISRIAGKIESYAVPYDGAVWCGEKPKEGSFKWLAKKYCD